MDREKESSVTEVEEPNHTKYEQLVNVENKYSLLEQEIKKVRYPTYAISSAESLSQKIKRFKDKKISQELRDKLKGFNSYRQVRGDGNCFFRALAFSYIRILGKIRLEEIFGRICEISLTTCNYDTIPKDFVKFYEPKFLRNMLEKYWEKNYQEVMKVNENNNYKGLIMLFDKYPFLDFIVILYFRSLCLLTLNENRQKFEDYLTGNEEDCIKNYSEETEGVLINLCSKMAKLVIHVYEIRADEMKEYHYDVEEHIGEIHLLFYENHYDIIEYNEHIKEEENSLMSKEFYGEVNKSMEKGKCIECGIHCDVYKESLICEKCESKVEHQLKQFEETKMIKGKCNECKYKQDIYETFGLCRLCLDKAKRKEQEEKKNKEREEREALNIYWQTNSIYSCCKGCKEYTRIDKEAKMCRNCVENNVQILPHENETKFIIEVCFLCFKKSEVNADVGICKRCTQKQIELEKNEKARENKRNHSVAVDRSSVFGVTKYGKESQYGISKLGLNQEGDKIDRLKVLEKDQKNKDENGEKTSQYQMKEEQILKMDMTESKRGAISEHEFGKKFLEQSIREKTKSKEVNDEYDVDTKEDIVRDPFSAFSEKKKGKMMNCKRCQVEFYQEGVPFCQDCSDKLFNKMYECKNCNGYLFVHAEKFVCKKCYVSEENVKNNRDKLEEERKQRILLKNNKSDENYVIRNKTEEYEYPNNLEERKKQEEADYSHKEKKNDVQADFRKGQIAILEKKEKAKNYIKSYFCQKCNRPIHYGKSLCERCLEIEEKKCRICRSELINPKAYKECTSCRKEKNSFMRSSTMSRGSNYYGTGSQVRQIKY